VPDEKLDVDRELTTLEAELKRLEAEYNMFFAGRLPRLIRTEERATSRREIRPI
jgi:hypothetical protein